MTPRVAIVSLNWNGLKHLKYFLPTVSKIEYENFFTIIVDNGSTDSSIEFIKKSYHEIEVLEMGDNLGYSKGFNKGIEHAIALGAEYILITSNDVELDKNIIKEGISLCLTD